MKRKITDETKQCIAELYDNKCTQAEIKFLLEYECGIKIPYHTINDLKPSSIKRRRVYARIRNKKPDVMKKKSISEKLSMHILDLFDGEKLSAHQIRTKINEKFGVNYTIKLEDTIDRIIRNLEKNLGENSPVICVGTRVYELNKNSPYRTICGGLEDK